MCAESLPQELASGQLIPAYPEIWSLMGFETEPISFDGIAGPHIRKMCGNSFNQGCFVAWLCYVLAMLKPRDAI